MIDMAFARVTAEEFDGVVRKYRPDYPDGYAERMARGVLDGIYDSIAPATGDYSIRRVGAAVLATIAPLHPEAAQRRGLMPEDNVEVTMVLSR